MVVDIVCYENAQRCNVCVCMSAAASEMLDSVFHRAMYNGLMTFSLFCTLHSGAVGSF